MTSVGRRLQIQHHTGYRYADTVDASFNEVRMTPITGDGQTLIAHQLIVTPAASLQTYVDYWGAVVQAFDVHVPHVVLEVTAVSTVETPAMPADLPGVPWKAIHSKDITDAHAEFLALTGYVDDANADPDRASIVARLAKEATPKLAARGVVEAVRNQIAYASGVTTVYTTAQQAWNSRQGVCQDFTHATLSLLRALGIPARYVSGYLHTEHPAIGETVRGESHAWVEYWDGGWQAVDPTNNRGVGAAHVVVARGRDYADVPPLKGIYAGGASEGLGVVVEITQIK